MSLTSKDLRKSIGEEISGIRRARHLNLREMTDIINAAPPFDIKVSISSLFKYENACVSIPAVTLEKIRSLAPAA